MKKALFCLLFLPLLYFCGARRVPVYLKNFTLLATVKEGSRIYMVCGNGKFVGLGVARRRIHTEVFQPPELLEESLGPYEELECGFFVKRYVIDGFLGVVSIGISDFQNHTIVGRLVERVFTVQFTNSVQDVHEQLAAETEVIQQPTAAGSEVAPVRLERGFLEQMSNFEPENDVIQILNEI